MINFNKAENALVGEKKESFLFKSALFLICDPQLTFCSVFQYAAAVQLALIQIGLQLPFLN